MENVRTMAYVIHVSEIRNVKKTVNHVLLKVKTLNAPLNVQKSAQRIKFVKKGRESMSVFAKINSNHQNVKMNVKSVMDLQQQSVTLFWKYAAAEIHMNPTLIVSVIKTVGLTVFV